MKVKFLLKDSEIPKTWYNVMADMPNPPAAVRSIFTTRWSAAPSALATRAAA